IPPGSHNLNLTHDGTWAVLPNGDDQERGAGGHVWFDSNRVFGVKEAGSGECVTQSFANPGLERVAEGCGIVLLPDDAARLRVLCKGPCKCFGGNLPGTVDAHVAAPVTRALFY